MQNNIAAVLEVDRELPHQVYELALRSRVYDLAHRTPLTPASVLSAKLNNQLYLKREDQQPVHSYKLRGAYNKISSLPPASLKSGLICASAGNHAQGVAYSARKLGVSATIVMPVTTPAIKIEAVRRNGAKVVLFGDSYSDAANECERLRAEYGLTYIPPFDDLEVIAGQATVGLEICETLPDADYVFVPVGGGGLIAGVAAVIKERNPRCKIIGVEPEDSAAMTLSIKAKKRITLNHVGIFADGVAVKQVGELPFAIAQTSVDSFVLVTTDEICSSIKNIFDETRTVVEPAGALALAGAKKFLNASGENSKKVVAIVSGANMNFAGLQFISERVLTGEKLEALYAITIPERAGALREFCGSVVVGHGITEFNYRLNGRAAAQVFVGISVTGPHDREKLSQKIHLAGYEFVDLTENSLAKTHIRHMVGGRSSDVQGEVLYSFVFPERPGALAHLLAKMSESWNISLFHYRMNGGDYGRVLIGFEIPLADREQFARFLEDLGYPFINESENPAYRLFL